MSNGQEKHKGSKEPRYATREAEVGDAPAINAESIYKALAEARGLAQQCKEIQLAINDKIINAPTADKEKEVCVDRAESTRHIPAWFDYINDIQMVMRSTLALQEHLLSHM